MKTIVIDQQSIEAASAGQLDLDPLSSALKLPEPTDLIKCMTVNDHGYVLSRRFQPGDAILVISLKPDGPLTALSPVARDQALARILKCTALFFAGRSRSIPLSWRPFHANNRVAFQADRLVRSSAGGRTDAGRIVVEFSTQDAGPRAFACLLDRDGDADLAGVQPDTELFRGALHGVAAALKIAETQTNVDRLGNAVDLGNTPTGVSPAEATLSEWYSARLTVAQRKFVDHALPGSIRLVGPAGSGKTVALVVKCLRELHLRRTHGETPRYLFLTHAASTANAIENVVLAMDADGGINLLASDNPALKITTLQSLANEQMRYNLDDLTPVSLDGHEGRAFQADILNEVIEEFRLGDWITFKAKCSPPFAQYMEIDRESHERRFFLWQLLNEFACVLDAEGVRSGTARREQYLSERRMRWMMHLDTVTEREVVLRLYDDFRSWLRKMRAIGSDQMITDFLSFLDGFRWENTRASTGFDAVFVDELHLFNRQERLVFKQLMRDPNALPTVLMAYDAKQSPRDAFLGLPRGQAQNYDLWKDARLGKVEKIELVDVFRYTPQIVKALKAFDQSFPGQDLDDEWPAYSGISQTRDGPVPIVCVLQSTVATYTRVFNRAREIQRKLGARGRVAVLCPSEERFKRLISFNDLSSYYHLLSSRDDASVLPNSTRRFVFSTPEYVAGLQFNTVLLIEANADEVPTGAYATSALRKFASQLYLGASRAEHRLEIYASEEHGGVAPLISQAVLTGAVVKVSERDLAST